MAEIQLVKDIINDWDSDDEPATHSLPMRTYERKKKNSVSPEFAHNMKNSAMDDTVNKDGVNVIMNNTVNSDNGLLGKKIMAEGKVLGCLFCGVCEFKTNVPNLMKAHMRKHSRKNKVICEKCFRTFSKGGDLVHHIRKIHRKVVYKCSICKFKTNKQSILRKHIVTHRNVKLVHINIEKKVTEITSLDCTVCGYKFESKSCLMKHMKLHQSDKLFVCYVCKNMFKKPDDMKRIEDTKNGLMQFQCKCNYKYTMKNAIRGKLILSEGERPFQCDICMCRFRHPHVLTLHLRSHLDPSSYKCSLCSNSFRQMAHLKSHLKSHNYQPTLGIAKEQ